MELKAVGRVLDVKHSNGMNYVTFNDTQLGGEFQLTIPGTEGSVTIDSLVNIHAVVKPGRGKFGMYLKVEQLLESNKKGE